MDSDFDVMMNIMTDNEGDEALYDFKVKTYLP